MTRETVNETPVTLEPERYELHAAPLYQFDLGRRAVRDFGLYFARRGIEDLAATITRRRFETSADQKGNHNGLGGCGGRHGWLLRLLKLRNKPLAGALGWWRIFLAGVI